jgi:hypothetical protein
MTIVEKNGGRNEVFCSVIFQWITLLIVVTQGLYSKQ